MATRTIRRLLIANRGEIAVRIARACAERGIRSVAVASEADAGALHTRVADESVVIGPAAPRDSYLRGDLIVRAACERDCDAIHPGYGFLAENAAFARAVLDAGLIFVGPPPEALATLGDKIAARRVMEGAGVPVVPGFAGTGDEDEGVYRREAARLGLPLLVKAAAGGGGRGMRVLRGSASIGAEIAAARREATQAFGDGRLLLERFLEGARHVEVQLVADAHGACVHLFERDCSIQRRFQKIVEETPAPGVGATLRARLTEAAVAAARAARYVNAGTVEFLVGPDDAFHFLEVNARLQVEHPVTECLTGVDLVRTQIAVAAGEPLPFTQDRIQARGHALECRVLAEDPEHGFAPASGVIAHARFPSGPGVRVDAGVESGDEVPMHYDALIAKIIAFAEDRPAAVRRMERALAETEVIGVATNVAYLRSIVAHPVFHRGEATTGFVGGVLQAGRPRSGPPPDDHVIALALADLDAPAGAGGAGPWTRLDGFVPGGGARALRYAWDDGAIVARVEGREPERRVVVDGRPHDVRVKRRSGSRIDLIVDGRPVSARVERDGERRLVSLGGNDSLTFTRDGRRRSAGRKADAALSGEIAAGMDGTIAAVHVAEGDRVEPGAILVVLEAMKMEMRLAAPFAGRVRRISCRVGEVVERGRVLVSVEPAALAGQPVS